MRSLNFLSQGDKGSNIVDLGDTRDALALFELHLENWT